MRGPSFSNSAYMWTATVPPITAYPISVSAWVYVSSFPATQYVAGVADQGGDVDYASLYTSTAGACGWLVRRSTTVQAIPTAGCSANTLHHLLGVSSSSTSHACYLDGGNKGTAATNVSFPTGLDGIMIGVLKRLTITGGAAQSRIGEVAIWNATLTDDDAAALAAGYSPLLIQPHLLRSYIPCGGLLVPESTFNEPDLITGVAAVETGTVAYSSTHPQIIHARQPQRFL